MPESMKKIDLNNEVMVFNAIFGINTGDELNHLSLAEMAYGKALIRCSK